MKWRFAIGLLAVIGAGHPFSPAVARAVEISTGGPNAEFPTAASAGTPEGWQPTAVFSGDYVVQEPGTVVADIRINGNLIVAAPNVTVRNVEIVDGRIENASGSMCQNGLLIEDTTLRRGSTPAESTDPAVSTGGYTARNVLIDGLSEGFRVGGKSLGCDAVRIENSYVRIVAPDVCDDWHGDGIQGYDGKTLTLRNTVIELVGREECGGTAPFFYPDQANAGVDIDGLIVIGGGYPFRLSASGDVRRLGVAVGTWGYAPTMVDCSLVGTWQAAAVRLFDGQPVEVYDLPCQ